ncbi:hypothetical protein FRX31_029047 [Thalictrum thalictroides]|uniref:Uncharacterized protein n=1 Tax=Thalictrum thalictroides TaxID=46969 RepID=A0A7J6V8I9_THATH|nr:hypothetical protein FRX31_029047 [Thalictrum thalictroides]
MIGPTTNQHEFLFNLIKQEEIPESTKNTFSKHQEYILSFKINLLLSIHVDIFCYHLLNISQFVSGYFLIREIEDNEVNAMECQSHGCYEIFAKLSFLKNRGIMSSTLTSCVAIVEENLLLHPILLLYKFKTALQSRFALTGINSCFNRILTSSQYYIVLFHLDA